MTKQSNRLLRLYAELIGGMPGKDGRGFPLLGALKRIDDGWLTLPQAESYLLVSSFTVRRLVRAGRIRTWRAGYPSHATFVRLADCQALLEDMRIEDRRLGGCVNQYLPQTGNVEKSKPKSRQRRKQVD